MSWDDTPTRLRSRCLAFGSLFTLVICCLGTPGASSETFPYEDAVTYCRGNVTRPMALSDDRSIVCFDGGIHEHNDFSPVEKLKDGGLFVVRSEGGNIGEAIALARLVHDRHAVVVVYDACYSACAVYLLTATDQAAVRRNSLVLWHFRKTGLPDCFVHVSDGNGRPQVLRATLCDSAPEEHRTYGQRMEALSTEYLRDRTLAPGEFGHGLDAPESDYVRIILKLVLDVSGDLSEVYWTWNPRFYKTVFRTHVIYEAYPKSQDEVDALGARLGLHKVIFDP
jgi:hypothetical protein